MVHKVFEFGQRQVREVMIPRPDIVGIEAQASVADLLKIFTSSSHSRFPVYSGDLDNITGFVSVKDVLLALAQDPTVCDRRLSELVRPTIFVPETKEVGELFHDMRSQHMQIAAIIDEYGAPQGLLRWRS